MSLPFESPGDPSDIKGSGLPTEQPDGYRFIKGQGWTTVKTWHGPKRDALLGKANELIQAGFTNVSVENIQPGIWSVQGSIEGQGDGSETEPEETWEIDNMSESADIATHPYFQGISNDELRKVLEAIKNPQAGTSPALTEAAAIDLYDLLLRKFDTYAYSVPMLRLTQVPAQSGNAFDGLELIWAPADIGISTPIVAAAAAVLLANNPFGTAQNMLWGWKQDTARITEDTNGRSRFTAEWILALWPAQIVGVY